MPPGRHLGRLFELERALHDSPHATPEAVTCNVKLSRPWTLYLGKSYLRAMNRDRGSAPTIMRQPRFQGGFGRASARNRSATNSVCLPPGPSQIVRILPPLGDLLPDKLPSKLYFSPKEVVSFAKHLKISFVARPPLGEGFQMIDLKPGLLRAPGGCPPDQPIPWPLVWPLVLTLVARFLKDTLPHSTRDGAGASASTRDFSRSLLPTRSFT